MVPAGWRRLLGECRGGGGDELEQVEHLTWRVRPVSDGEPTAPGTVDDGHLMHRRVDHVAHNWADAGCDLGHVAHRDDQVAPHRVGELPGTTLPAGFDDDH